MSKFLLILKFLPYIVAAVKAVEDVVGAGNGKAKKEIIMDAITAVAVVGSSVDNTTVATISTLVDGTVKTLNGAGVFKVIPVNSVEAK